MLVLGLVLGLGLGLVLGLGLGLGLQSSPCTAEWIHLSLSDEDRGRQLGVGELGLGVGELGEP